MPRHKPALHDGVTVGIAELPEREPSEQASVPARTDGSSRRVALTTLALTLTNGLSVLWKTQATHRGVTAAGFALSLAPDRKGDSLFAALMSHGTESASPPPPAPSATWSAADTATVGVSAAGAITNTGEVSLPWSFASQANLTITPSAGTLAAGGTQPLSIVAAAAATYVMTLVSAGASITGNDQTMVATVAAVAPTSATLSGSSSATTGVAHTSTVTLDHPADQAYTITWSRTGGATGVSTSTITTGQTAVSADDTWATAGSGSVDFTISPSLTRSGRPLSVTIADPAAPGALPSITLAPAVSGTLPFAFGHAFRQGDVPAGQVANAASATDWQCTPMTYWPDGSLKHAIIAGRAAVTSGVDLALALTAGAAAGGAALTEANLASALPATTIAVDADTTDLNALIGTAALHTTVCTGPVMSSWVYRRPVSGNNHLVVFVEVRLFKGGEVELFPWVENGYLSVASPTNFVRTCTVTIGGVSRFSQSIDIKHHTRVPLITGAAFSHWAGSDPQIKPKHDRDYLIKSKLIPNLAAAAPAGATLDALQQTYTPNTLAGDTTANGSAGGEGGVVSVPSAYYVTSSADTRAYSAMMVHALSSGSWSHHYRDEATNLPIAFSAQPLATLADTSTPTIPTPTGGENAAGPAMSHSVSYAYLPWLLTGRWWFLEELHFWATFGYLSTAAGYRGNGAGWHVHAQPRFRAWSLNVLAQSASVTPASHPLRAEFLASWEANTSRHYGRFVSGTVDGGTWVSPIGVLGTYSGDVGQPSPFPPQIPATGPQIGNGVQVSFPTTADMDMSRLTSGGVIKVQGVTKSYPADWTVSGKNIVFTVPPPAGHTVAIYPNSNAWWDGAYQQNYLATVFGYTRDIGIPQSAQSQSDHVAVSTHAYKLVVGRADDGLNGRYNWRRFIAYGMPVGTDNAGLPLDSWYSTHDQAYAELVGGFGLATLDPAYGGTLKKHSEDNDLGGSSLTYGSTALSALALAVDHGALGASAGWHRVSGASNFSLFDSYLSDQAPYWSVRPRVPEYISDLVPYQVRKLTGSYAPTNGKETLASVEPSEWTTFGKGVAACIAEYSGGAKSSDKLHVIGGGHSNGAFNGVLTFDPGSAGAARPGGWSVYGLSAVADVPAIPPAVEQYLDGRASSRHTYDGVFKTTAGVIYTAPGGIYGPGGVSTGMWKIKPGVFDWTRITDYDANPNLANPSSVIYDPATNKALLCVSNPYFVNWKFLRCDDDTLSAAKTPSLDVDGEPMSAWDSTRGRALYIGQTKAMWITVDFAAETVTTTAITTLGSLVGRGLSVLRDDANDRFLAFGGKSGVSGNWTTAWEISADAATVTARTLTGDTRTVQTQVFSAGRYAYVPEWRAVFECSAYNQPVSVMRI